jgi:GTP cyclohydrolase I
MSEDFFKLKYRKLGFMESQVFFSRLIASIGDDPAREGLKGTPERILNSYKQLFKGYGEVPEDIISTSFVEGACKELVVLRGTEFYSHCEHHMLPFFGTAHVGYLPNGKVVGVSKIARLVDCFSRRLQIQERLTAQIADTIYKCLNPFGVAVVLEAQHLCMSARGVSKKNSVMVTSALRGVFEDDASARSEFLGLCGLG